MIHHLSVTNFRAIRGTRAYQLQPGVTALIGRNEAGKSSSFLALAWALYGGQAMPDGIDADDLINDHAKECRVEVHLEHNGDDYVLIRSQNRSNRGDASLTRNGQPLASGRSPVTQAITNLFGVDHVGFMVSVFARQDELDALAGKKGAERVSTMLRLLGVDQAEAAVKGIRKQANEERRSLELLRAGVLDVDSLRSQHEAQLLVMGQSITAQDEAEEEVANRTQAIEALRSDLDDLAPQREAFDLWREAHRDATSALATARARAEDAQRRITVVPPEPVIPTLSEVEEVDDTEVDAAEEEYVQLREGYATAAATLRKLTAERDGLTDTCAACRRPFDNAEQVAEHRALLDERITNLQTARDGLAEQGEAARGRRDALVAARGKAALARVGNERKQAAYDQAVRDRQAVIERNATAEAEAEALQTAWDRARLAVELLTDPPADPTERERELRDAIHTEQWAIAAADARIASATASIAAAQANLDRIESDLNRAAQKSAEITATEQRVVTLDVAAKEMVAMKERLIGRIIPALEERAGAIVTDLTDGKHTELHLTSDYEIQYVTETGGLRSFANLSGGAKNVFALALRLAIAELRAGSVSFLVLDEVFAAIDDERQGLAWEAIERLQKRYDQVLLITHVAALKERAANVIVFG